MVWWSSGADTDAASLWPSSTNLFLQPTSKRCSAVSSDVETGDIVSVTWPVLNASMRSKDFALSSCNHWRLRLAPFVGATDWMVVYSEMIELRSLSALSTKGLPGLAMQMIAKLTALENAWFQKNQCRVDMRGNIEWRDFRLAMSMLLRSITARYASAYGDVHGSCACVACTKNGRNMDRMRVEAMSMRSCDWNTRRRFLE